MYEFGFLSTKYHVMQINNILLDKNINLLLPQIFTKVVKENIRKTPCNEPVCHSYNIFEVTKPNLNKTNQHTGAFVNYK